jgi:sugar-specific transcriptional regulator TrmB
MSEKIQKIYDDMEKLGFSRTESSIYLNCFKFGHSTITEISNRLKLPRTTIHENVERLLQKGLLSENIKNNRRKIIAESPNKLSVLLLNKRIDYEEKLKEIDENTKSLVPELTNRISEFIPNSEQNTEAIIRYYVGERGFKETCQRSLETSENEVLFLSNVQEWRKIYTVDYGKRFYVPERKRRGIFLRSLAIDSEESRFMKSEDSESFRETRILPEWVKFKSTIIITDSEVAIMHLPSKPYKATLISDKDFAEHYRQTYEMYWNLSS